MQGKQARSLPGSIPATQAAGLAVSQPIANHHSSVMGGTNWQQQQPRHNQWAAAVPICLPDQESALPTCTGIADSATAGATYSPSHDSQMELEQGRAEEASGKDSSSAVALPIRVQPHGSEPQSLQLQSSTPSRQRPGAEQPPTPLSSHPIADELIADSDSLNSSGHTTPSRQLSYGQPQLALPVQSQADAAHQTSVHASTLEVPQLRPQAAAAVVEGAAVSSGTAISPALLDTSSVLLQFGSATDDDRLLSPASTSASEQLMPVQQLPKPAAESPLFCRDSPAADESFVLPANCAEAVADCPDGTADSSQGLPRSPAGIPGDSFMLSTTSPCNNCSIGQHSVSASSNVLPASLDGADCQAASPAQGLQAVYCAAADQLQSAVQQAVQLYTQALRARQQPPHGSNQQPGLHQTQPGTGGMTTSMQQMSLSLGHQGSQASDNLVRHALRRAPSPSSSAAAAWVPQDTEGSMPLLDVHDCESKDAASTGML